MTQRTQTAVNAQEHVTARTDAAGRQTTSTYAANGIDLATRAVNGVALTVYRGYDAGLAR